MTRRIGSLGWVAMLTLVSCLAAPDISESGKYACGTSADCASDMACREQSPGVFRCVDAIYREEDIDGADFPDCWEWFSCDYRGLFSVQLSVAGSATVWGQIDGAAENHTYFELKGGPDRDVFLVTPPAHRMVELVVRRAGSGSASALNPAMTLMRLDGTELRFSGYGESAEVRLRHAAPGGFDASAGLVLAVEEGDNYAQFQSGFGWLNPEGGPLHDYVLEVTTEPLPLQELGTLDEASPMLSTFGELSMAGDVRYFSFCAATDKGFSVTVTVDQPDIEFAVDPLDASEDQMRHRSSNSRVAPGSIVLESSEFVGGTACDDPSLSSMRFAVYERGYQARLWTFSVELSRP